LTFLISAYALGRSGVFSSFFILCASIIYGSKNIKYKKTVIGTLVVLIVIPFIYYLISVDSEVEISRFKNLKDGGREEIVSNVIGKSHFYNYILGFNPNDLSAYREYGHLHSSILNLFSVIGIMGVFYFSAVLVFMYKLYKQKNIPLLILYIGFYIRISTDVAIGFGFMDYLLWLPITTLTIKNNQIRECLLKDKSKIIISS
jgi:hypothetical protein